MRGRKGEKGVGFYKYLPQWAAKCVFQNTNRQHSPFSLPLFSSYLKHNIFESNLEGGSERRVGFTNIYHFFQRPPLIRGRHDFSAKLRGGCERKKSTQTAAGFAQSILVLMFPHPFTHVHTRPTSSVTA